MELIEVNSQHVPDSSRELPSNPLHLGEIRKINGEKKSRAYEKILSPSIIGTRHRYRFLGYAPWIMYKLVRFPCFEPTTVCAHFSFRVMRRDNRECKMIFYDIIEKKSTSLMAPHRTRIARSARNRRSTVLVVVGLKTATCEIRCKLGPDGTVQ